MSSTCTNHNNNLNKISTLWVLNTVKIVLFQIDMVDEATRKFIENYRDEDYQDNLLLLGQDIQYFFFFMN